MAIAWCIADLDPVDARAAARHQGLAVAKYGDEPDDVFRGRDPARCCRAAVVQLRDGGNASASHARLLCTWILPLESRVIHQPVLSEVIMVRDLSATGCYTGSQETFA